MLTTKERALLKGKASTMDPIFQIGKNGVTAAVIEEIEKALFDHELIKVSVLKTADLSAKSVISELADAVEAEAVQAIGNRIILYKRSKKDGIKHVLL